jgi:two-component system KDP operon response regulator KdpE
MRHHQPQAISTRVLCVGADTYLTDLLRYALTREGFTVKVATCGVGALDIADRWSPHAAIVERELPDLRGHVLCSHLRRYYGSVAILLTARPVEGDRTASLLQAADSCLTKPFSLHVLTGQLRGALHRWAPADEHPRGPATPITSGTSHTRR